MPAYVEEVYFQEIARIQAYESLALIKAVSYPHLTQKHQGDLTAQLSDLARVEEEKIVSDPHALARILGGNYGR